MVKTILIPTDGSEYGKTAIEYGIYIAKKLEAQLIGLHVVDVSLMQGPVFSDISGSIGLPPYQEFLPVIEAGLDERADAILKTFREQWPPTKSPNATTATTGGICGRTSRSCCASGKGNTPASH